MRRIKNILFSLELTGLLLIMFAVAIGIATFIENDFGTMAAKARVYNAKWFEVLLLLLAVNMAGSIFKQRMYLRHKWTILLFHLSFIIIFLGAAVTRYIGYEGTMSIREGKTSDEIRTDETYIRVWAENDGETAYVEKKVMPVEARVEKFKTSLTAGDQKIKVDVRAYYTNAGETMIESEEGDPIIWLVFSGEGGRTNLFLPDGEIKHFGGYSFGFNREIQNNGVVFTSTENGLMMESTDQVSYMNMAANTTLMLSPDSLYPFEQMSLYKIGQISFVFKQYNESARMALVSTEEQDGKSGIDAFEALVTVGDESKIMNVYGGKGYLSNNTETEVGGVKVTLNYGSKAIKLPFAIKLEDFQLERYPGSHSPSSYASEITLIDESKSLIMPYRVYMNNVLNYGGYRFFQSSYDRDELGTIFSVNHDGLGTAITYIGYLLMAIGMFFTIFNKNSRFKKLFKLSSKLRESRKTVTVVLVLIGMFFIHQSAVFASPENEVDGIPVINKEHARAFGKLLVQDRDGRIKPVNTVASEVLRKLARKSSYKGMSPEQVFLGIMAYPQIWEEEKMIKVANDQLQDFLGVDGKYAAFSQIVDLNGSGQYKLSEYVELAYAKKPSMQSKFDKEVMKVDERVNIFYMVYSGSFLTSFPIPNDPNHSWVTSASSKQFSNEEEALFVSGILSMYYQEVRNAVESGNWTSANKQLEYIKVFQNKYGAKIMPSDSKVKLEIFYNEFNIFKRLSSYYGLIGFILIILHFISILKPKFTFNLVIKIASGIVVLLFLLHTAGLAMRWSISGYAPWSNGYESLIYIGWATILSGLIFVWRSQITLAVTALLTSLILAVAGMSWMDPEITNLVPVLKSYWLIIHVAIITASYGFLALGALLGFFNLLIINLKTKNNFKRLDLTITELTYIIEMTIIVGLFMLTVGTFLGGVWANESWGRYWGWDPKETWALVTVLVYSFVVHMRFIPGFRGNFALSFAALVSYGSVMMTYFGVNYYLSGLHSYAKGDPVPVPSFVYYTVIVITVIGVMGWLADRRNKSLPVKE
ncbi:MAG: cytochrome c biogenesis protein CcsA [Bacteroidales bacterium]|nr:cytochrome c biogenesis protein CcsA [Bacteroidales bacterium]MCF8405659.1 cytochrome c biogenesis protein CcsA [Bacteroidales bacterium]